MPVLFLFSTARGWGKECLKAFCELKIVEKRGFLRYFWAREKKREDALALFIEEFVILYFFYLAGKIAI